MFVLVENGAVAQYPFSIEQLKSLHPNISFAQNISDNDLMLFNVERVYFSTPIAAAHHQYLVEEPPVFNQEAGRWEQVWAVRDLSAEQLAAKQTMLAEQVRADRNTRLAESDWTQLADAPGNREAWIAYRQALRDITAQPGFPWEIDWPAPPA